MVRAVAYHVNIEDCCTCSDIVFVKYSLELMVSELGALLKPVPAPWLVGSTLVLDKLEEYKQIKTHKLLQTHHVGRAWTLLKMRLTPIGRPEWRQLGATDSGVTSQYRASSIQYVGSVQFMPNGYAS